MTDVTSTTLPSITSISLSSTLLPSTLQSTTFPNSSTTSSTSTWTTPTNTPQPWEPTNTNPPRNRDTLIKVLLPVAFIFVLLMFTTWYCFQYRGKLRTRDRRLQEAGIPLGGQFPGSVYPVPLPRPKTPPTPPVAPAYEPPVSGEALELPPPGYNARS